MPLKSLSTNILLPLFKPSRWSIGIKILVAILLAAILPMIVVVNYNLQQSLERIEASQYYELELLAATKANQLDRLISDRQNNLNVISIDSQIRSFLASDSTKREELRSGLQSILKKTLYSDPSYDAVYLLGKEGRCIASTNPLFMGENYAFRSYFAEAIKGNSVATDILFGASSKQAGLYTARAVRSPENSLLGVVVLKINQKEIWSLINEVEADSPTDTMLVDRYGIIVSHSNPNFQYKSLAPLTKKTQEKIVAQKRYDSKSVENLGLAELANKIIKAKQVGHMSYYSASEKTDITIGFAPLKIVPWVIGVTKPKAVFLTPVNNSIWQSISSVLLVTGIATLASFVIAWSIVKPIRLLILGGRSLAQDRFKPDSLTKVARSKDDVGELARVFLDLAQKVEEREQELKQQVSQLQIEIDEGKKKRDVAEVTNTDYFKQLQRKANKMKQPGDKQA